MAIDPAQVWDSILVGWHFCLTARLAVPERFVSRASHRSQEQNNNDLGWACELLPW
jgi:hypothetical protein